MVARWRDSPSETRLARGHGLVAQCVRYIFIEQHTPAHTWTRKKHTVYPAFFMNQTLICTYSCGLILYQNQPQMFQMPVVLCGINRHSSRFWEHPVPTCLATLCDHQVSVLQPVSDSQLEEWAAEISSINVSRRFLLGQFGEPGHRISSFEGDDDDNDDDYRETRCFGGLPSAYLFLIHKLSSFFGYCDTVLNCCELRSLNTGRSCQNVPVCPASQDFLTYIFGSERQNTPKK